MTKQRWDTGMMNSTGAEIWIEQRQDRRGDYFVRTDGLQKVYSVDRSAWFQTLTIARMGVRQ